MQPLEGVRVVSIEQAVAAPLCSKRLLLAGAEVFKVERPEGDFARFYDTAVAGESSYFVWLNGGKKSVVFDLREAEDVRLLEKLISRCDVLVQNLKPGALEKLGLGLTELHARYPHLISVSISGFHPDGPGAQRKAYDLLMQAEAGLASITGSMEAPGRVGVSIVDIATGMFAYEAVLEAVLLRHHSGTGERISVALFDAVAQYMSVPYLLTRYGGGPPARVGLAHPGICPYGVFESADQIAFVLSVQNEAEWQRLCQIDGSLHTLAQDKRCADNETRVAHRAFVDATLQVHFASTRYVDLAARLDAADMAFAPVNGVPELVNHADLRTTRVAVNSASIELPVVPGRAINAAADSDLEMPDIGAHTEEVLQWLRDGQYSKNNATFLNSWGSYMRNKPQESPMAEALVPITLFAMIFGIVAIVTFYRYRNRQELQLTIRATLESGQALSSELLEQLTAALQPQHNDVRRGVILLAIGLAFVCLAFLIGKEDAVGPMLGFSAFPILTSFAYLLMGYFGQKSDK